MKVMTSNPLCISCGVEREASERVPITSEYDIMSYECPTCKSVVRLVEYYDAERSRAVRDLSPGDFPGSVLRSR